MVIFIKKIIINFFVTLALFFFRNYTLNELHQILLFGLPSGENSPRERRRRKKEKNRWEVAILLFHSNVDQNCKFSTPKFSINRRLTRELQKKNNKNNEIILLILLSHCGKAGTIILILCYGNWHKVYTDVRYGMSCGSPLLSSMCICEWTKTKNQRIQAKDVLVLCILLAGDFFVLSGRLFCLQHIQLIHPRPPPSPHPPLQNSLSE